MSQQLLIFGATFLGGNALRKKIRIESGRGSEGENLSVVRIHRDDYASALRRLAELILGRQLKIAVDREHDVLTRLWFNPIEFTLNVSAAVHHHATKTITAAQSFIVHRFDAVLSDEVARFVA